ncbi:MAG: chitobiase/beta-hexosaminidase C-terminal domain-containing protein [Deltaproteobacteria bacterium]|nr:chitobiase/beta-hexosaminidase C-terminal domain-containing protein [Deltaproteobacteria bacterium]
MRSLVVLVIATGCFSKPDRPDDPSASDAGGDALPRTFPSPGPAAALYNSSYPTPFSITLAADDPAATIYYTTDGSVPDTTSLRGPTPVTGIMVTSMLVVSYFAETTEGSGMTATETFRVATSSQNTAGYLVTNTKLDGTSPVVVAAPNQTFDASASVQVWVQSSCPGCSAQLVYGVGSTDQGCLFDGDPGVFPGDNNSRTFSVTAPATPGVHEVLVAHIEQANCNIAMSMMALATRPTVARIGVLVVR